MNFGWALQADGLQANRHNQQAKLFLAGFQVDGPAARGPRQKANERMLTSQLSL